MGFRDRFNIGLAAILLLFGVVAAAQATVSDAEITRIKAKIEAGEALSNAEITQVEEINASTSSRIDLVAAFDRARAHQAGDDTERSHGGSGSLDIWTAATTAFSWRDISTTGTDVGISGDDALSAAIPLGLPFRWFGTTPTEMRISTNGYLLFSGTANTGLNTAIPDAAEPNNALYVFWDDLIVYPDSSDYVKYEARADTLIVSWRVHRVGGTTPIAFQAILRSGTGVNGRVTYQYQSLDVRNSCTVGIEDATGAYALQMCYNGTGTLPGAVNAAYNLGEPAQMPLPVTALAAAPLGTSTNVALTWTNPTADLYGAALTGGVDSTEIYLGTTLLGRVYGQTATFGHGNTATGNLTYTVYAWNNGFQSYPVTAATTVAAGVYDYVEDFEVSGGGWTTFVSAPDTTWQWGTPTNVGPATAHSGTKCWGTNISGRYGNNACYQVELNPGQPVTSTGAGIGFWAWYKSEGTTTTYDGTHFRVSTDAGATWTVVAPIVGAYDDSLITANNTCIRNAAIGGPYKWTWNGSRTVDSTSGISCHWRYFVIPLGQFNGQTPLLRFVFGSDPAAANYPGFYFDDVTIWGITPGAGHTVQGTVTLDGGGGSVAAAVVHASGLGLVSASPAAGGAYSLLHVQPGNQVVWVTLAGYQTAVLPVTVAGNVTGANLTVRRLPPAAPTNVTANANASGVVTVNWDDSPDLLVDQYKIYAKLPTESVYTLKQVVIGRTNSAGTDTLTEPGSYQYVVTAVDTDVLPPAIESAYSARVDVSMGALAPKSLYARGDWDDHVHLSWVSPSSQPLVEMSYDNGVNSPQVSGIGFATLPNFGWFAAKYHVTGTVAVHRLRVYFTNAATIGDQFQIGLFADNGSGRPTVSPLATQTATMAAPLDTFRDFVLATPEVFTNGTFYVGVRQMTGNRIAIGGDMVTPFVNNTFFHATTQFQWSSFDTTILAIPMMRAVAQSITGAQMELAPTAIANDGNTADVGAWAEAISSLHLNKVEQAAWEAAQIPVYLTAEAAQNVSQLTDARLSTATDDALPFLEAVAEAPHGGSGALDEQIRYNIYRNGAVVGHTLPAVTVYDDYASETTGVGYTYYVTAFYSDSSESAPSNSVISTPRMAPGMATSFNGVGTAVDQSMRLTWTDPTVNADNSPCSDLTRILIYRSGILIDSVSPGTQVYTDHVLYPNATYTWALRAVDEVRNIGPAVTFAGATDTPWQPAEIDWADISTTGTNTNLTGDDQTTANVIPLGFTFPFYGTNYTSVKLCINGWLSFLPTTSTNYTNGTIPATGEPNATIYAFWDDLYITGTGEWVKYKAEPGRFIASWHVHLQTGGTTPFDFQIILEDNGAVTINYLTAAPAMTSYTLGVENAAGTSAIMLYNNGAGAWSATADTAVQFFAPPPIYVAASGHVSLDGGAGQLQNVVVSASGNNHPSDSCDASGYFEFDSVAVGTRSFAASMPGYTPASTFVAVPLTGISNVNLVLRREAPPTPVNFTAVIVSLTQIVTLDWDVSEDPLVDFYRVYRRLPGQGSLTLLRTINGLNTTSSADTLVSVTGAVQYAVSAIDTNVTLPWLESAMSTAGVTGGHPAPWGLSVNGNYDNLIHVEWHSPDEVARMEAGYDNGHNSASVSGIGWWGEAPGAGWIATRFEMGSSTIVDGVSCFFTSAATPGAPVQVALFADANGVPGNRPLAMQEAIITEPRETYQRILFSSPLTVATGTFYVAVRQMTEQTLGLGGDEATPYPLGTFVHNTDGSTWEANEPTLTAIPMLRAVITQTAQTAVAGLTQPPQRAAVKVESFSKTYAPARSVVSRRVNAARADKDGAEAAVPLMLTSVAGKSADVQQLQADRLEKAVEAHAPLLQTVSATSTPHGGAGALDQVISYHVYRDGVQIAVVPPQQTYYNDMDLTENELHAYYVTAEYDDGVQSGPSNTGSTRSNMAPGQPTELSLTPQGATMVISWYDPIINADGSPCNDLTMMYVQRLLGTTPQFTDSMAPNDPGVLHTYINTPPVQTQLYTWKVWGRDEVRNMGAPISRSGIVEAPWHEVPYSWVDISQSGTWLLGCGNDEGDDNTNGPVSIGFPFTFYGTDYTTLRICSNGWLSFNSGATDMQWAETALPNAAVPNALIAPLWDDLALDTSLTVGHWIKFLSTPNRFVVTWRVYKRSETIAETFNMQVILEPNGGVTMQWQDLPNNITTFTTGVENQNGTQGITLNYDLTDQTWIPYPHSAVRFWGGQSGSVGGVVTAQTGNVPIPNVSVWATTDTDTSDAILTDGAGSYMLRLPPATYSLHFDHPAYCDAQRTVVVENNLATTQNLQMQAPQAQMGVTSFTLEAMEGHDTTATFTIRNQGGQCPLDFTISDTSGWLSVDPDTGVVAVNQTVTVTLHCDVDSYELHDHLQSAVVVTYNAAASPSIIPVDLDIVPGSGVDDPGELLPTEFALKQNYPNPFNPTTDLRFDVPRESFVKLVVYNIMGQEVARPVNSRMVAGRHRVTFDAGTLPTGMYLVRMDADGFSAVSKMMLLK